MSSKHISIEKIIFILNRSMNGWVLKSSSWTHLHSSSAFFFFSFLLYLNFFFFFKQKICMNLMPHLYIFFFMHNFFYSISFTISWIIQTHILILFYFILFYFFWSVSNRIFCHLNLDEANVSKKKNIYRKWNLKISVPNSLEITRWNTNKGFFFL